MNQSPRNIDIEEYNYNLPDECIAFYPLEQRNQSKLLVYQNHSITDSSFNRLCDFLNPEHLLIFNDSKVIHARLLVKNQNNAQIEIFCLEPLFPTTELSKIFEQTRSVTWKCMIGNAKRWKEPISFVVPIGEKEVLINASKGEYKEGTFEVCFEWDDTAISFAEWIEHHGNMPLPPYIKRSAEKEDEFRYQTVYAHHEGSVAAPTAGLHFSEEELRNLEEKGILYDYVTLHVGAGTFKPVSAQFIGEHFMHREQIIIRPELLQRLLLNIDKKIIAVGTTVARSLESIFIMGAKLVLKLPNPLQVEQWEYYDNPEIQTISLEKSLNALLSYGQNNQLEYITASTSLLIAPGYQHKIVRGLITNFHQPKSTLLLLIASFLGDEWKSIYAHAIENNYRFLSYGDSNLYL